MDSESSFEESEMEEKKSSEEKSQDTSPTTPSDKSQKMPKKTTIRDYEFLGILGEGSFGKVHHVVKKCDGEQYALKVITKKNMTKKLQVEIQRERSLLMKVDHPNIIKLHQCFHDAKNLYFAMDWCTNGELFNYMTNEGVLDIKIAQFLAAELVNIITYLKEQNICHRDIKPGNILFDENMHLKLIDFGWGKFYKNEEYVNQEGSLTNSKAGKHNKVTRQNTFIGTWEYMAPEIVEGIYISSSWDLWSLGIIIYKFFAEFAPFLGEYEQETLDKITGEEIDYPEDFPEIAKDLWNQLLIKDPTKRLGAGPAGSINDSEALKSHPFFEGIDFENLYETTSPVPKTVKRMNSMKQAIIQKYKKQKTERATEKKQAMTPLSFAKEMSVPLAPTIKRKIEDWKYEKNINIIHKELIHLRSRMLFYYHSVISLTTDEPAFYIYSLKAGTLKERYDLKNWKFSVKGKNKFKFSSKGKIKYKKISNTFKVRKPEEHHRDSMNAISVIQMLKKYQ